MNSLEEGKVPISGLLYKEWKQRQTLLLLTAGFLAILGPLAIINEYFHYKDCLSALHQYSGSVCTFSIDYSNRNLIGLHFIPPVMMGLFLIRGGRAERMFTLSLPYSRSRIFHTKFFLGAAVLAGSQFVSYGVSDILFLALKPDAVHHFQSFSAGMLVISLMIYALVTAAGTITGNLAAQLITAFTVSVFPIVVMTIYLLNAEFLFGRQAVPDIDFPWSGFLIYFMPAAYIHTSWMYYLKHALLISALMGFCFYLFGYVNFLKMPSERSGHFILSKHIERTIQVLVMVLSMLGSAGVCGYAYNGSYTGYIFGMLIGAVIGFFISYYFIYKKTKQI
nr:ABC transporter permease [Bacillus velezensis]